MHWVLRHWGQPTKFSIAFSKRNSTYLIHCSLKFVYNEWGSSLAPSMRQAATSNITTPLRWRHNEEDGVSNHQPYHCLLNRLVRRKSKKTSKPRVTGLCARNSPGTGEFPAQMASNAENVSIWWRHYAIRSSQWVKILYSQDSISSVTVVEMA